MPRSGSSRRSSGLTPVMAPGKPGRSVLAPRLDADLSDSALLTDPYPLYEQIRAAGRVVWNGAADAWMVPGFDDCVEMLFDSERFSVFGAQRPDVLFWFKAPNMITAEGADHRRLRRGLARFFTPAAIKRRWEPRVREVVDDVLAPLLEGHESVDLIAGFAKVPVVIVAELLGVPEERQEDFRRWSDAVVRNIAFGHERPESRRVIDEAVAELNDYLNEEIERHRREKPDDLLTVMVSMPEWTEAEIHSSAVNLLLAGYAPTAMLMGACLVVLEQHPDQRRLVAENPVLVPNAIEEVLRWAGAPQVSVRVVVRDTVLADIELASGDALYALL